MKQLVGKSRRRLLTIIAGMFLLTALVLVVAVPWIYDPSAYTPSPEKLRSPNNPSRAFIVEERDMEGLYGNLDVDAAIYTYRADVASDTEFWAILDLQTQEQGWELKHIAGFYRRYVRIIPKTGQHMFHSAEEVRVAIQEDTLQAWVAWVQADERQLPQDFPKNGEGRFARKVVWPRFVWATRSDWWD